MPTQRLAGAVPPRGQRRHQRAQEGRGQAQALGGDDDGLGELEGGGRELCVFACDFLFFLITRVVSQICSLVKHGATFVSPG